MPEPTSKAVELAQSPRLSRGRRPYPTTRTLLRDLVALPSAASDDPRPILSYVEGVGRELGASPRLVRNGTRPALLLSWGRPRLLFSGHLDTVPRSGTWKHRDGTVRKSRMYGRGTTDMKAGCAAILSACSRLGSEGNVGVLYTTDEETRMDGARAAVEAGLLESTALVVVAEPTHLRPCLGQKGVLQLRIETEGVSAHASMPWAGTNAIGRMGRLLAALAPLAGRTPRQASTLTASPDVIEGGVAMNVVADRCSLALDVRYAPRLDERQAMARVEAALGRSGVPYRLEIVTRLPALRSKPGPAARRLRALTRRSFGVCDFATEAARFGVRGTAFVICGPGRPEHCHIMDESIDLDEVDEAARLYVEAFSGNASVTRRS